MAQQNAWAVECTQKGSHSDDEREKIMVAIHYTLTHNKGTTDEGKIGARLKGEGFSKIFIKKEGTIVYWTLSSGKCSNWKVNDTEYYIYTDLVLR